VFQHSGGPRAAWSSEADDGLASRAPLGLGSRRPPDSVSIQQLVALRPLAVGWRSSFLNRAILPRSAPAAALERLQSAVRGSPCPGGPAAASAAAGSVKPACDVHRLLEAGCQVRVRSCGTVDALPSRRDMLGVFRSDSAAWAILPAAWGSQAWSAQQKGI